MKSYENHLAIRKENLLNELKGNLFEFLVGSEIARFYGIFENYYLSIPEETRERLKEYEGFVQDNDVLLLQSLPALAKKTFDSLSSSLPPSLNQIFLVGKVLGASQDQRFHEADLLLLYGESQYRPISLKLCKWKSFVNTKNAGVQSIIENYFAFEDSFLFQKNLNDLLTKEFEEMALDLMKKVPPLFQEFSQRDENVSKFFSENWTRFLSDRPGDLSKEMRERLFLFYSRVIKKIYDIFLTFYHENKEQFLLSLFPLCGFGNSEILQVNCFHGGDKKSRYQLKGISIVDFVSFKKDLDNFKIGQLKRGISSFEIHHKRFSLQIRVKPMNKFTVKGLKVNCSVKHL